jgi:hypothetical protein
MDWEWIALPIGLFIIYETASSVGRTLIVPRGYVSRITRRVDNGVRRFFLFFANRFDSYERKDEVLVLHGPMSVVALLVAWLALFLLGFSLVIWPLTHLSFEEAVKEAGSSLFTLGFASSEGVSNAFYFIAAATGLIVVALLIAYLPSIYGSFNRREGLVTMLQSRAGSPPWGPEILARHQLVEILDNMPHFYSDWEAWAADVAESHTNYPVLVNFRSPHPLRSWIVALLAVLDSAALYHALSPGRSPTEARLCLRMGFLAMRDIADALGLPYETDPFPDDPIELTYEEFLGGVHRLEEAGFPMERTPEEAWPHFRGWRVNYESVAYALADLVVAPPGPWSGPRHHLPGLAIAPIRPANRTPEDPTPDQRERGRGHGH